MEFFPVKNLIARSPCVIYREKIFTDSSRVFITRRTLTWQTFRRYLGPAITRIRRISRSFSLSLSLVLLARARCNSLMLIISHASLDITMTKYVYLYGVLSRDVTRRAGCLVGRNRAVSWEKIITGGDHEREWSRERKRTIVIAWKFIILERICKFFLTNLDGFFFY